MARKQTEKTGSRQKNITRMLIPAALGLASTVILTALLILVLGRLAYSTEDPSAYSRPIGLSAIYISAFIGGLVSSLASEKSTATAIIHAAACLAILLGAEAVLSELSLSQLPLKLLVPVSSALGYAVCLLRLPKRRKPKFRFRSR